MKRLPCLLVCCLVMLLGCNEDDTTRPTADTTPPAQVTLSAEVNAARAVVVTWRAPGDDGLDGAATRYSLRYSSTPIDETNWTTATVTPTPTAPKPAGQLEAQTISGFTLGTWYLALKSADEAGNWSVLSNVVRVSLVDSVAPARVSNLAVASATLDSVVLRWTAPADDGPSGRAESYDLRYAADAIDAANWDAATPVPSVPGPRSPGSAEEFTVTGLPRATLRHFALRARDPSGNWSEPSNDVAAGVAATTQLTFSTFHSLGVGSPEWSPDGARILFNADWDAVGWSEIYVIGAGGGAVTVLTETEIYFGDGSWSPGGDRIACCGVVGPQYRQGLYIQDASPGSLPRLVLAAGSTQQIASAAWSPDGRTLAYALTTSQSPWINAIFLVRPDGGANEALVVHASMNYWPSWAPDGHAIVFASNRTGVAQLWEVAADGGEPTQLTFDAEHEAVEPAWSPDGKAIAFARAAVGNLEDHDLWVMRVDGGQLRQLTFGGANDRDPAWSPAGDKIAFSSNASGEYNLWVLEVPAPARD